MWVRTGSVVPNSLSSSLVKHLPELHIAQAANPLNPTCSFLTESAYFVMKHLSPSPLEGSTPTRV